MPAAAIRPAERWALPASQARSRATRARLLSAAETVFAEKGYDGARLADIADEAGCSVGAVYFRFKDKDALFFAIVESFIGEARRGLAALLGGAGHLDRDDVVRLFVNAAARNFRRHKGLFRAIVERGIEHPHAMKTMMAFRDELAATLEKAIGSGGKVPSLPIRVMTQMIYGFMLTGVLNKQAPTKFGDARAIEELASACIAYLGAALS